MPQANKPAAKCIPVTFTYYSTSICFDLKFLSSTFLSAKIFLKNDHP